MRGPWRRGGRTRASAPSRASHEAQALLLPCNPFFQARHAAHTSHTSYSDTGTCCCECVGRGGGEAALGPLLQVVPVTRLRHCFSRVTLSSRPAMLHTHRTPPSVTQGHAVVSAWVVEGRGRTRASAPSRARRRHWYFPANVFADALWLGVIVFEKLCQTRAWCREAGSHYEFGNVGDDCISVMHLTHPPPFLTSRLLPHRNVHIAMEHAHLVWSAQQKSLCAVRGAGSDGTYACGLEGVRCEPWRVAGAFPIHTYWILIFFSARCAATAPESDRSFRSFLTARREWIRICASAIPG